MAKCRHSGRGERQLLTFHQHLYDLIAPCPRLSVKFYSGHFNFAFRLSSTLCSDQANQHRQKSRKVSDEPFDWRSFDHELRRRFPYVAA